MTPEEYDRHYLPNRQKKKRAVWLDIGKRDYVRHAHREPLSVLMRDGEPPKEAQIQIRECVITFNKFRFGEWIYAIGFCMEEEKKFIARVYPVTEEFKEYARISAEAAKKKVAEEKEKAREAAILAEYERQMK